MAKIYAEIFVADQRIATDRKSRSMADTTLVYEPIFRKYGYTTLDYQASMEHYIKDADRFARILRESSAILEAEVKELKVEMAKQESLEEARDAVEAFAPDKTYYLSGADREALAGIDSALVRPWPLLPEGKPGKEDMAVHFDLEEVVDSAYFAPVVIATHAKKLTER